MYTCGVPADRFDVIVWRLMPECERGVRDISFLRNDDPLYIVCDDGRKIKLEKMDISNETTFVTSLNVTNITSSQRVECLYDDGSEKFVGHSEVFTTGKYYLYC